MCKFLIFLSCLCYLVNAEDSLKRTTSASASIDLCGTETEIELTKSGETSSRTITLSLQEHDSVCKLKIIAPNTHVINVQFIEPIESKNNRTTLQQHPPCVISFFLPENPRVPVWKGDLCSDSPLSELDLLPATFRIIWNPPKNFQWTKGRKFVITAVGQGTICKEQGQHTCMRIGWNPLMCISNSLVCNGITNCPKSATTSDEDEKLCKKNFFAPTSLEQLAVELFKKWKPPELINNNKWLHDKLEQHASSTKRTIFNWRGWQEVSTSTTEMSTTTNKTINKAKSDSISQVLSKYGPWGYLMLGMLICGTVLMFCGLWECCFRKPKSEIEPHTTQQQPTTVLIINQEEEPAAPNPPNYDELDQPPSYTTLFPNFKTDESTSCESETRQDSNSEENNINTNNQT